MNVGRFVVTILDYETDANGKHVLCEKRLTYGDVIARRRALSRQLVDLANCDPTLAQFHEPRKEDDGNAPKAR